MQTSTKIGNKNHERCLSDVERFLANGGKIKHLEVVTNRLVKKTINPKSEGHK